MRGLGNEKRIGMLQAWCLKERCHWIVVPESSNCKWVGSRNEGKRRGRCPHRFGTRLMGRKAKRRGDDEPQSAVHA